MTDEAQPVRKRSRRWWIVFIVLICLALAWVGLKYSEKPPYRFMDGADLYFVESGPEPSDHVYLIYIMRKPFPQILTEAKAEVPGAWNPFHSVKAPNGWLGITSWDHIQLTISDSTTPGSRPARASDNSNYPGFPPVPPGITTLITLQRPWTPLDRIRAWMYGLRWEGSW